MLPRSRPPTLRRAVAARASRPCVHASRERIGCTSHDTSVRIARTQPRATVASGEPCSGPVDTYLLAYQRVTNRGNPFALSYTTMRRGRAFVRTHAPSPRVFRLSCIRRHFRRESAVVTAEKPRSNCRRRTMTDDHCDAPYDRLRGHNLCAPTVALQRAAVAAASVGYACAVSRK